MDYLKIYRALPDGVVKQVAERLGLTATAIGYRLKEGDKFPETWRVVWDVLLQWQGDVRELQSEIETYLSLHTK